MGWMRKKKKKDIIRLEKESVIPILKSKLISSLSHLIENKDDRVEFLKFCKRVDSAIRAWYFIHFEDLLQLYTLFDPVHGAHPQNLSPEDIDNLEHVFLTHLFQVLEKGNFKISTDEEIYIALSAQYRLNLPIIVDESKLDRRLLRGFFANNPHADLPFFAEKYLIFRRGVGIDRHTAFFIKAKINTIIARSWRNFLKYTGLKRFFSRKPRNPRNKSPTEPTEVNVGREGDDDMFVERIHIENMKLGLRPEVYIICWLVTSICKLLSRNTIQEPTFERIIVLYRRASSETDQDRNIYVKHFKNIPMADLEIVLPEKKNPTLTPVDWIKFILSALMGLITIASSLQMPKADVRVIYAILSALIGYCIKTYFTFQKDLVNYQNLIAGSMYDKQLDSGRSTLLRLCDDVIQQEVKEVIISFFILMQNGKASKKDIDLRCEELIRKEFGKTCNFDVDDAIQKLDKLGIVSQDALGDYSCVELRHANRIIGMTTEEVVIKAKEGSHELTPLPSSIYSSNLDIDNVLDRKSLPHLQVQSESESLFCFDKK